MTNQSILKLIKKLKDSLEQIERETDECKKNIELLEVQLNQESEKDGNKVKAKTTHIDIDPKSFVAKIESEFKNNNYDSLSWLLTGSKLNLKEIISLLKDGGIILSSKTKKANVSDEVKQILSTRYSFSKS